VPLERKLAALARRQVGCQALMRQYGVGPVTATTVLCELGDVARLSASRKAVRCSGLDIGVYRSDRRSRRETCSTQAALLTRPSGRSRLLPNDPSTISAPASTAADPDKPGRPRSDRQTHNPSPPALTSARIHISGTLPRTGGVLAPADPCARRVDERRGASTRGRRRAVPDVRRECDLELQPPVRIRAAPGPRGPRRRVPREAAIVAARAVTVTRVIGPRRPPSGQHDRQDDNERDEKGDGRRRECGDGSHLVATGAPVAPSCPLGTSKSPPRQRAFVDRLAMFMVAKDYLLVLENK
jgi:hypothetical protein